MNVLDIGNIKELEEYKSFLNNHKYYDYMQSIEWNVFRDAIDKYIIYTRSSDDEIESGASLFILEDSEKKLYMYCPRGPIVDYEDDIKTRNIIENIIRFAKNIHVEYIIFNPKVDIEFVGNVIDSKHFTVDRNNYELQKESPRGAIVEVSTTKEELILKFNQKTRYNIKKSQRENLEINIKSAIDLDDFYSLYKETARRHSFNMHNEEYFHKLFRVFGNSVICCEVKYKNVVLAMSINLIYRDTLIYLYGVSGNEYRTKNPCYRMHWEMIKYALENRIKKYDFGGVFCNDGDINNKDYGLLRFKKGFCYKGFKEYMGQINIVLNKE